MNRQVPRVTLAVSALAVLATGWPALGELLVYHRGAVLAGEVWRLATAPLFHFSWSHLFWDLSVFGAMGWCIEGAGDRRFGVLCAVTCLLTGLYVLSWVPDLARYGGLSGPATAAVVYFGVCGLRILSGPRWPWLGLLGLVAAKVLAESLSGPLFVNPSDRLCTVLVEAHLIGAGCGLSLAAVRDSPWSRPDSVWQRWLAPPQEPAVQDHPAR